MGVFNVFAFYNVFSYQELDYYFAGLFATLVLKQLLGLRLKPSKKKLRITARVKRQFFTLALIILGTAYLIVYTDQDVFLKFSPTNVYSKLTLFAVFSSSYILIVHVINLPFELSNNFRYLSLAKWKLKRHTRLVKVGITGSFGKTSSKNVLKEVLSNHYYILASPKSFNTPMGLTITIRQYLKPLHQMFIAEMGAYKRGEIKELANLVKPKYGILTWIGPAHLESFGSMENIQKGKFELIESLPSDGCGVLNYDNKFIREYQLKNDCQVVTYATTTEDVDLYLFDVISTKQGTTFKVKVTQTNQVFEFETKLLGLHNIYNIVSSLGIAYSLGIDFNSLKRSIRKLKPIKHRLEIKDMGSYTLIDDSFNSNPVGSKTALDILSDMVGQKIIITPGMIELGSEQYRLNMEFGQHIAAVCDEVILVGKTQTKPIQDGLSSKGYNNYHVVKNINAAFALASKVRKDNCYILIENDLPDLYNE